MLAESVSEEGAVKGRQREGRRRGGDGSLDKATDGRKDRLEPDRTVSSGGAVSRTLPFQGPVSLQYCSYKAQIKAEAFLW